MRFCRKKRITEEDDTGSEFNNLRTFPCADANKSGWQLQTFETLRVSCFFISKDFCMTSCSFALFVISQSAMTDSV